MACLSPRYPRRGIYPNFRKYISVEPLPTPTETQTKLDYLKHFSRMLVFRWLIVYFFFLQLDENKTNGNEESFKQLAIELEQKLFEEFYNKEGGYFVYFRRFYL